MSIRAASEQREFNVDVFIFDSAWTVRASVP